MEAADIAELAEELTGFLKRAIGYTLTGLTVEDKLFFAHGAGASGKSTFLEALKAMLGDYAVVRNDIARLAGSRMVLSSEVEEGKRLAEAVLKALTGGDTITARYLHRESFEYIPRFTLWLAANDRPHVNANDTGMWRRIVQVPFTEAIPEAERDPTVKTTLKSDTAAQSAILTWAVEGCLEWQKNGLQIPERVREYTEEYRAENDPFRDFFDEKCVFDQTARISRPQLRRAMTTGHTQTANTCRAGKRLADALRQRGIKGTSKLGSDRAWSGITLIDPNDAKRPGRPRDCPSSDNGQGWPPPPKRPRFNASGSREELNKSSSSSPADRS